MEVSASAFYAWAKKPEDTDKTRQREALAPSGRKRPRLGSFSTTISKFMAIGVYPMRWQGWHDIGTLPSAPFNGQAGLESALSQAF
jgi:hypothetical protein